MEWEPHEDMFNIRPGKSFMAGSKKSNVIVADMIESDTDFHIHMDLPGVQKSDIDITLSEDTLEVSAHRRESRQAKDVDTSHLSERSFGVVSRKFNIPRKADISNATATLEHGVLMISVGKLVERTGFRKLEVN